MVPSDASGSSAAWRVGLRRNFWPYFLGNLLSNCGTWIQNIAQAIFIYDRTHSALLVGVVNFAQFIGVFALAPLSGSAADRFDRRRLLIATQIGATLVTAVLAALTGIGWAGPGVVIVFALMLGLTTAFAIPAMQALVPLLVAREELAPAVALNSLTFNLARAIGPGLGALVFSGLGAAAAFGLNSFSYLALVAALLAVRPRGQAPRPLRPPRLVESIRMLREDARLAALLCTVAAISLTADPVNTLTPGFATRLFHRSETWTGVLVTAFGTGAAIAALTVVGRLKVSWRSIAAVCALEGVAMWGFGLSTTPTVASIWLFVAGLAFLTANTAATTEVQLEVDDSQRGRVMALWGVAFLGVRPFGSLVDGGLATAGGLRFAAFAMAAPALAIAVVLTTVFRSRALSSAAGTTEASG